MGFLDKLCYIKFWYLLETPKQGDWELTDNKREYKHIYGGNNSYTWKPHLVAFAFSIISFSNQGGLESLFTLLETRDTAQNVFLFLSFFLLFALPAQNQTTNSEMLSQRGKLPEAK